MPPGDPPRKNASNGRCLVVTPTFNEKENLEPFLESVFGALSEAHVLVVDDASPDGTGALADRIASTDARVHVLHRACKRGLGTAYVEGFKWGLERDYDYFFEMDTDLSHDARDLPRFVAALDSGADLVVGSRNISGGGVEGWGLGRHLLSKGGSLYSRWVLGASVRDMTTGYKGYARSTLEALALDAFRSNGYAFQIETTYRALRKNMSVVELPIVFFDRRVGQSKMSRMIFLEAITSVWRFRWLALRGKL